MSEPWVGLASMRLTHRDIPPTPAGAEGVVVSDAPIPYGEGWPWPRRERRPGTVYRRYDDRGADVCMILAHDENGDRRGVEVAGIFLQDLARRRQDSVRDCGQSLFNDDDWETALQAPEAWCAPADPLPGLVFKDAAVTDLARALWQTDHGVQRWVGDRADSADPTRIQRNGFREHDPSRLKAAFEVAWRRGDPPLPGYPGDMGYRNKWICHVRRALRWLSERER